MTVALQPEAASNALTAPEVSEFAVVRVSGAAPGCLDSLALPRTHAALCAALAAERGLEETALPVEEALYALVPALGDEPALRRAVLALKRDVHNARVASLDADTLPRVIARLPPSDAALLERWIATAHAAAAAAGDAAATLEDELAAAGRALAEELGAAGMRRALALGSPAFLEDLLRREDGGAGAAPGSRLARTGVAYLSRAAAKTSPFSSFTELALARIGADQAAGELARPRRRAQLARALAVHWLLACARDESLGDRFEFELTRALRVFDGRPWIIVPSYGCVDGFYWRRDDLVDATTVADDVRRLAGLGRTDRAGILAALGGADPQAAFVRLLDQGVLRPLAPWDTDAEDPLGALAHVLHGTPAGTALASIVERARDFAEAGGGERIRLLAAIRRTAGEGLRELGAFTPPWIGEAALVYEDVSAPGATAPPLGEEIRADLERLGEFMRPHVVRSRLYDELTARFVERFGAGGECRDVLGFLLGFLADPRAGEVFTRVVAQDAGARERPHPGAVTAPVGPSSAPPAVAVAFQLAAADRAAFSRGEYLLVLNQHNPGIGAALARFRRVLDIDADLRGWIDGLFDEARPHVVSYGGDWNDLQAHGLGLLPSIGWPGELPGGRDGYDLNDLVLRHDARRDTLDLLGPDGGPVAPVYLGSVPQYLILGPVRLLLTLGDPWINASPAGRIDNPRLPLEPAPDEVEFRPRWAEGRLVLRRAVWRVPPGQWPVQQPGEGHLDYLRRAEHWRGDNGLPVECYLTLERPNAALSAGKRKPLWTRFDSLHALRRVGAEIGADVVTVRAAEALPGRGEHWAAGADGRPRACEHMALLRWERPR